MGPHLRVLNCIDKGLAFGGRNLQSAVQQPLGLRPRIRWPDLRRLRESGLGANRPVGERLSLPQIPSRRQRGGYGLHLSPRVWSDLGPDWRGVSCCVIAVRN